MVYGVSPSMPPKKPICLAPLMLIWMRKVEGFVGGWQNTLSNTSRTQEDDLIWTCLARDVFYFKKSKRDTKNKMRNITQVGLKWPRGLAVNNCKEEAKLHQPKGLPTRLFSSSSSGESLALMWIRTQLQALQAQQAEEGIMNTAAWQILPGLNLIISLIFYYEMTYHSVRNAMWAHTKIKLRIIFLLE